MRTPPNEDGNFDELEEMRDSSVLPIPESSIKNKNENDNK